MSLILSVVHLANALPAPMPQIPGVNVLPAFIRTSPLAVVSSRPVSSAVNVIAPMSSSAPAVGSAAGNLLGAVVNPIVSPTVTSVAVSSGTVPAASLLSANTGTGPLLGGLVGGVVVPLASPSSGSGILNGLLPVTSPLGGALTDLGGVLNNAVGGVADTVGGIASSVELRNVGGAVETVGAVVGGVAGDTLSVADNVLFGSGVSGALPTGAPLVNNLPIPGAPNVLDSALLLATDVLNSAFPLAADLLALTGDAIDTFAPLATNPFALPEDVIGTALLLATDALAIPTDVLQSGLLSATGILNDARSLPTIALAAPTGVLDNTFPTAGSDLGVGQGISLYLLTDLPSAILGSLPVNQYGDVPLSALSSLSSDVLGILPQDVLSLVDLGALPSILPTDSGNLGSLPSDATNLDAGAIIPDILGTISMAVGNFLNGRLPTDVLDVTNVLGALSTNGLGNIPVVSNLLNSGLISPTATSDLINEVLPINPLPTNILGDGLNNLPSDILDTLQPPLLGVLPGLSNIPGLTSVHGRNVLPLATALPVVSNLLADGGILGPITSGLLPAVSTSAPSVISILPGVTVGAGGGIGIDTPILDAGAGGGTIVAVPPFGIPGLLPGIPGLDAQAVPGLVSSLLPAVVGLLPSISITSSLPLTSGASVVSHIDPILNILKPSNVGLLTSVPNQVTQALNDTAQHLSPNDPNFPGWQAFGCFTSNNAFDSTLTLENAVAGTAVVDMTPKVCIARCVAQDANYASVIDNSCFCSAVAPPADAGSNQCTTSCAGDVSFVCGNRGVGAYSVFKRVIAPESLVPLPLRIGVNGYQYSGCYYGNSFIANAALVTSASKGISDCSTRVSQQNYKYAALQATTCYASNNNFAAGLEAGIGLCSTPCSGSSSEACGGTALAVNTGVDLTQLITLCTANPSAITSPALTPDTESTDPTGPEGSFIGGCVDATAFVFGALTNGRHFSNPDNNGALCYTQCSGTNFLYSLVNSASCYCSSTPPSIPAASQPDCTTPCPADLDQRCGGLSFDGTTVLGNVLGTIFILFPLQTVTNASTVRMSIHALSAAPGKLLRESPHAADP
ncbi:hypothetical protein B5807_10003 [Epicoccum nigrum]|uniref:WSC domain-containing protein n=1 Tax=Epicoccum nigrum TaxID=105696 RepID=A0A1Y2LVV9_EPING|nr:hypothetical protein B5807_10003 [Epicoccum nigrum]